MCSSSWWLSCKRKPISYKANFVQSKAELFGDWKRKRTFWIAYKLTVNATWYLVRYKSGENSMESLSYHIHITFSIRWSPVKDSVISGIGKRTEHSPHPTFSVLTSFILFLFEHVSLVVMVGSSGNSNYCFPGAARESRLLANETVFPLFSNVILSSS